MKLLMENWRKFLAEEEKDFEAHTMFDPKTGDKKQAKTEAEHNELAKKGYVHTDPAKIRKALEDEGGAAGTDAIVDRTDASDEEVKKAMDAMPDVAQHDKGDYILGDKDKIKIEEDCWDGYERVPGSKEGAPGSCRKKTNEESCDDDKEELDEDQIDEASICKAGKDWVDGKTIGGQKVSRGEDGKFNNWSARAAQIASKYCKDPNYGRGKKKKKNESMSEGDLGDWEKENWTHSDGTPCGGGDKDGSQSRCKPASKWKGMTKGEKAADNAKKKAGTDAGKQYVSATKKGKVTKAHTKEAQVVEILADLFEGCGEPAPVDYDHGPEASMHRSSLHTIKGEVEQLLYMIGEQDDLPEWLEAKITKAKAYLSAAKDYLSGEQAEMAGALEEQLADAIVVEYLEEDNMDEGGRCTKATEKTTSTRKGKKYMKCIKNPDGEGYIRKHWGQKGARAAPKGSKRNKSFNKRHKCSTAKPGTARKLACDDW